MGAELRGGDPMNMQCMVAPICASAIFLLALYIGWRYSNQRIHRVFAVQIVGVAGYMFCLYGLAQAPTREAAEQWLRYGMVLPYVLIFTWYWFCVVFSRAEELRWTRWLPWVIGVPALIDIVGRLLGLYSLPPMELRPGQGWFPGPEWPYLYLYVPSLFALLGGGLGLLLWRLRRPWSPLERQNLLIMLAAMGIAWGFAFTCFLPQFSVLMPLAPLTYVVVITYGLSRRRLLNLNVLIREGALAALGSVLLTATVALIIMGALRALNVPLGLSALFFAALLFAFLFPFQQRLMRILLGRWLGRDVSVRQGLLEYSLLASANPTLDGLIRATLMRLVTENGLSQACLMLPDRGGHLTVYAAYPVQDAPTESLDAGGEVARALLAAPQGLDVDSLGWTRRYEKHPVQEGGEEAVREFLERSRMQACFGLALRGRLRGVLMVGSPESERGLLAHELDFFAALSGQLAGMLENAALEGQVQHADRLSTLGLLAASVAHEINNSLSSINVFLTMFEQRRGDSVFMEKFNRVVGTEMQKMTRLSDDMMNLSRPATQNHGFVDIGLLCEREGLLLEHPFRKAQVKLQVRVPEGVLVLAEETRLSQVILNLLLNALEVSPPGSTVGVELLRRHNEAELRVLDHGPGIKADQMGMLFEPFFTTKKDGHGLGLATSRRIMESFGGRLEAANAPGGGAEFTARLPLAQENKNQVAA
jgi:signal transduction histidine kinase